MDDARGDAGPRPSELLLVAQAGCAATDVIAMLRAAGQPVTAYEVQVTGEQRHGGPPHAFEHIAVVHVVEGDVSIDAVRHAIRMSATRSCSVTGNLASGVAEVRHGYLVRDTAGDEFPGQVVVTGPRLDLGEPARQAPRPPRARAVIAVTSDRTVGLPIASVPSDPDLLVLRRLHDKMPELLLELI
jgi:uncharacterized OsmC-like protein